MRAFSASTLWSAASAAALCLVLALGCKREEQPPVQYPYPAQAAYPGQPPNPGQPAVPAVTPPGGVDPINATDFAFLRAEAAGIMRELIGALPPLQQGRVSSVPLVVDSTPGEVNAFAACTKTGRAAMAVTDGLFEIQAHLARAKAYDEAARTNKVGEYVAIIARSQQPKQPLMRPPPGFFDPALDNQPNKLLRQRELLDEQLAFVLGHELAHHYLGHLPCTGTGNLAPAEIARVIADAVPIFNQPNEIAADISGLNDALTAGARRGGYHFTEGGALLTMQFFAGLHQFSVADIVFAFERDHPPPALRSPIISQTANAWRATGGRGLPYPLF
jgi:hypothetical protein